MQYPLGEHEKERITSKTGKKLTDITLDEVMKIQQEGKQKRREAEVEMNRLENELKTKLLQING